MKRKNETLEKNRDDVKRRREHETWGVKRKEEGENSLERRIAVIAVASGETGRGD